MSEAPRRQRPRSSPRAARPPSLGAPRSVAREATLPLFQTPEPATPTPRPAVSTPSRQLWVHVRLPGLAVEILPADGRPTAVVETAGGRRRVLSCDASAARAGVRPGLSRDGALALAPGLRVVERSIRREDAALARLAHWALQFSPVVSLDPPEGLCLEVRGSLRLFGGLEALLEGLGQGLRGLGHQPVLGTAPTATAARILARAGQGRPVTGSDGLVAALGPLPIRHLGLDRRLEDRLQGMGLRRIADLARMPRDGLGRRIGRGAMQTLDRALGRSPDPREAFEPPARFRAVSDLGEETRDRALVERALEGLVASLSGFLLGRQCGVQRLRIGLHHLEHPTTRVTVGLASPARDSRRIMEVMAERLERSMPRAPVTEVELESGPLTDLATPSGGLFRSGSRGGLPLEADPAALPGLVERLQARFGSGAVHGLCLVPEHRPERAWQRRDPVPDADTGVLAPPANPRPLWLFSAPELLATRDGRLWLDGPLRLLEGPERIESGWWDGGDVSRDYYIAGDSEGVRYWVYRERRGARRWFLHGIFG